MTKVLVTGAGGFIGSHLTELLVRSGFEVRAFVRYLSGNTWGWLDGSPCRDDVEVVRGDIRDYDAVSKSVDGCSTIFHLAALIGIPYSYESPLAYIRTNMEGTYNVLESARRSGLERVIVTSTSEVYGTARSVPMSEDHALSAQSPYAATKIAADQLALSFHRSFGMPVAIARPFNTYGPRQTARAIIPSIAIQVLSGRETIRLGNVSPTRDFTFVEDTAEGFLQIHGADRLVGQVTHIGSNMEISVGDLASRIAEIAGRSARIEIDDQRVRSGDSEVDRLNCDNTKLLRETGWAPGTGLEEGLRKTIEWIEHHLDEFRAAEYGV